MGRKGEEEGGMSGRDRCDEGRLSVVPKRAPCILAHRMDRMCFCVQYLKEVVDVMKEMKYEI